MGKRDYRHREPKKAKKESKKTLAESAQVIPLSTSVEVIKKGKKEESRE
jgi:hypothetical protein